MRRYDILILGAGVTGAAIARQLSKFSMKIGLLDSKEDVAMGASRANSAIIHAGYDCKPKTCEARLNVRGNELFTSWCEELAVPLSRCGSLVVGFDKADEEKLQALFQRGQENAVPGLELISGEDALKFEPLLNPKVTMALLARTAGITCPYQFTIACAENARDNGVSWILNATVEKIEQSPDGLLVHAGGDTYLAGHVVNAAGVNADKIAQMIHDVSFEIHPRKGEYMLLDKGATPVKTVIFQTPSALGKGILVSPTVDGNSFLGPTAYDQEDRNDTETTSAGMDELSEMAKKSVPSANPRAVITSFAGVRAQPSTGDFVIRPSESDKRMIHAAGICSPGLTSAPAIAEEVEHILAGLGLNLVPRPDYRPMRKAIAEFRHMDNEQRKAAIQENPLYGRVICRCETITEAEIVEAIRRGARSLDAVKRRTRAGMGRCQGGFCGPRVMDILARELKIPLEEVTKCGGGSWLVLPMDKGGTQE